MGFYIENSHRFGSVFRLIALGGWFHRYLRESRPPLELAARLPDPVFPRVKKALPATIVPPANAKKPALASVGQIPSPHSDKTPAQSPPPTPHLECLHLRESSTNGGLSMFRSPDHPLSLLLCHSPNSVATFSGASACMTVLLSDSTTPRSFAA